MNVGIAAFEYNQPIENALDRALSLGVQQVELAVPNNVTETSAARVSELISERDLKVTSVACLSKPNAVDSEQEVSGMISLLDESILAASTLGAPFVITYFGGHPHRSIEDGIMRFVRLTAESVRLAERLGITILVENHFSHAPGEATNTAQGCVDLVRAVDSDNFAINFDLCNFAIGGQPFKESYNLLKPLIRNVHIKDARPYDKQLDSGYDGRVVTDIIHGDFVFVPAGQGITPNRLLLDQMMEDGITVPITIEGHVPDDRLDACFKAGLEFVRGRGV